MSVCLGRAQTPRHGIQVGHASAKDRKLYYAASGKARGVK